MRTRAGDMDFVPLIIEALHSIKKGRKKAQEAQRILRTHLCLLCLFVALNRTFEAKR